MLLIYSLKYGGLAEWFKAHAWKACNGESHSWVRIPCPPPFQILTDFYLQKEHLLNLCTHLIDVSTYVKIRHESEYTISKT